MLTSHFTGSNYWPYILPLVMTAAWLYRRVCVLVESTCINGEYVHHYLLTTTTALTKQSTKHKRLIIYTFYSQSIKVVLCSCSHLSLFGSYYYCMPGHLSSYIIITCICTKCINTVLGLPVFYNYHSTLCNQNQKHTSSLQLHVKQSIFILCSSACCI